LRINYRIVRIPPQEISVNKRTLLSYVCFFLAAAPLSGFAESTQCNVITSLPTTISSPGVYCINQDLVLAGSSGFAVNIAADSVTLDLNGHALRSNAAANTVTEGVVVVGHKYFTIIDGTIAGFGEGINVESLASTPRSKGGLIADVKVQRSVAFGIGVDCDGCVIRNNLVTDTIVPASISGFSAIGIGVAGTGALVTGNRVFNTHGKAAGSEAFNLSLSASDSTLSQNYVANDEISNPSEFGVLVSGANDLVVGNQAQDMPVGFDFINGTTKYRDNLQSGCTVGFNGSAIDLGGNN
jgi:hypothetical protein